LGVLYHIFDSFKWFSVLELILVFINVTVLVWYAVPIRKYYRWFDFLPSAGLLAAIVSVLYGDMSIPALLLYAVTAIVFLCTVKKVFKPVKRIPVPKRRAWRAVLCLCGVIPLVLALMMAGEARYNPVSDFSRMSYSQAFVQLNERLSREYPFGEWKHVNWDEMRNKYEPAFRRAEQEKDKDLYYKTLREYLFSFRDGHIKIVNEQLFDGNRVFKNEVGGGVGISTIQSNQGKVWVNLLLAGSPAEQSGIKLGAEIVSWDGKEAGEAYRSASWSENPTATDSDKLYNQGRFMARTAIGKEVRIAFKNAGENEVKHVTLKAYDDNFETLKRTKVKLNKEDAPLEGEILSNGYGYIKLRYLLPSETMPDPGKVLEQKLQSFQEKQIKGLIIDVRDNPGGSDDLLVSIAGYFASKPQHYEYVSYYNRLTRKFEINFNETRTIQPAKSPYHGKTAVLVNHRTASSGEGLPLIAKEWPLVRVVGFTGTNGSFGIVSSPIMVEMPEGYVLQFPDGRSLDSNKRIQGDSDDQGRGGRVPDLIIPLNEQTFNEKYVLGQDVELNYAVQALENMK